MSGFDGLETVSLRDKIIRFIRSNRLSTTEVADAMGKTGSLFGVTPISEGHYKVGPVRAVTASGGSNYFVHEAAEGLLEGDVFLIEQNSDFSDEGLMGDLVAKYALLYKGAASIVVNGNVRDYARLLRERYPIWATGRNPVGATNEKIGIAEHNVCDGGIAVCDDGGVVIIPPLAITDLLFEQLRRIEQTEDLWYFCLDSLGMSTFEIVCKR